MSEPSSGAQQLKHTAADNYMLGAAILGEKPPADVGDETGPDSLRTKADVIQYVKDSFAYLHRAVATIDDKNTVIDSPPISPMPKGTATRLGLAVEVLLHTFDHYGQMVEYVRMNGVVPPASRLDAGGRGGMQYGQPHESARRLRESKAVESVLRTLFNLEFE